MTEKQKEVRTKKTNDAVAKIVEALKKIEIKKRPVGFTVVINGFNETKNDSVAVCCGWDYPETIANKVLRILNKFEKKFVDVSCCADISGTISKKIYVNGGADDNRFSRY